jgi:threonine dehydratase
MRVTLKDIEAARALILNLVFNTPLELSRSASEVIGAQVFFKFENRQRTGSFKIRGALNRILRLTDSEKQKGVIAASAGNHAQGVAASASIAGITSHIVMPKRASIIKQVATRGYGGNVILHGNIFDEAKEHALHLQKEHGYIFIPPYQDPHIIAGQGTLFLEIYEVIKDLDSIVVPIGGGGLISGVALAAKSLNPKLKVYGVVAENAPNMRSLFKKEPLPQNLSFMSIADGISVKNPSPEIYEHFISKYVDDIVAISENDIAEAIVFLLERTKTVVEGSGATTFAAMRSGKLNLGAKTCAVLSGGNIDLNIVSQIIARGLTRSGRMGRLQVITDDRPGALNEITGVIASHGANILEVMHDRVSPDILIRETKITFVLETKNEAQVEEIAIDLKQRGLKINIL